MHFFLEVPIFELYNIHMTGLSVQLGVLGTILRQFGRLATGQKNAQAVKLHAR